MDYINEIIDDLEHRMRNIGDFYPIYKIFSGVKTYGEKIDIPTLCMGVLSFLVYENNFKFNSLIYTEDIMKFIKDYVNETYKEELPYEEVVEISDIVIGKLTNKGYKFHYEYYSPRDNGYKSKGMKLVDIKIDNENKKFKYFISEGGLEFYLKTKEYNEEYKIEIMQIIFKKLIEKDAFEDALHALRRLNTEIGKLIEKRNSLISLLSQNLRKGLSEYESFIKRIETQCEKESSMFWGIKVVLDKAIERYYNMDDILLKEKEEKNIDILKKIEIELKSIIDRHSELINSKIDLINKKNEIIRTSAVSAFKEGFDFEIELNNLVLKNKSPESLRGLTMALWNPKVEKFFNPLSCINEQRILSGEGDGEEVVTANVDENYKTVDHIAEGRLRSNYYFYTLNLLKVLEQKGEVELKEFLNYLNDEYGKKLFINSDIISYIITLTKVFRREEGIIVDLKRLHENKYKDMIESSFIEVIDEENIKLSSIEMINMNSEFTIEGIITISNFLFKGVM